MDQELINLEIITDGNNQYVLFYDIPVRIGYIDKELVFSVVDICGALTDQPTPKDAGRYWGDLKIQLKSEGANELLEKVEQLKMFATDGKMRKTDVMTEEQVYRLIQSIPSPKAEPARQWLAKVGALHRQALQDPEKAQILIDGYRQTQINNWKLQGKSEAWIIKRLKGIDRRTGLTHLWDGHGIKDNQFAWLTNTGYVTWSGMNANEYKKFKGVKKDLRNTFNEYELIINDVSEMVTADLTEQRNCQGFKDCNIAAKDGGSVGKSLRDEIENKLGYSVISKNNQLERGDN